MKAVVFSSYVSFYFRVLVVSYGGFIYHVHRFVVMLAIVFILTFIFVVVVLWIDVVVVTIVF